MKPNLTVVFIAVFAVLAASLILKSHAAEGISQGTCEYATIRWAGRDNTHVIRPGGQVEFVGSQLKDIKRPDRADDRSLYMNVVMNGMARDGWEFAGMTPDDIVMRRVVRH